VAYATLNFQTLSARKQYSHNEKQRRANGEAWTKEMSSHQMLSNHKLWIQLEQLQLAMRSRKEILSLAHLMELPPLMKQAVQYK